MPTHSIDYLNARKARLPASGGRTYKPNQQHLAADRRAQDAQMGTKQIAQRIVNAEENFTDTLVEIAGISKAQAFKALATFRKVKAIKLDPVGGRYIVKHGAYMAPDVIRRAIEFA